MKTKILLMAALLAATTAFFSCSSDETLAEVLPEEPQPAEVLPTDSGIPLTVTASTGNDTRATMLTSSNFDSFQLWAFEGATPWVGNAYDAEGDPQSGTAMTKTSGSWNAPGANWPSPSSNSNFYAISAPTSNNLTPQITQTSQSFTYTVPEDAAQQVDLMVGAATASAQTDNGKINIDFRHILSKLMFTFKLDALSIKGLDVTTAMGFGMEISSVTLHNLYNTGEFTFSSSYNQETATDNSTIGSWEAQGTADKSVTINFDTPLRLNAGFNVRKDWEWYDDDDEDENLVGNDEYGEWAYSMVADEFGIVTGVADENISSPGVVLPQEITSVWGGNLATLTGAYITAKAKVFFYYKDEMTTHITTNYPSLTLSGDYYVDGSTRVMRKDGIIIDYSKLASYGSDLQITVSNRNGVNGGYADNDPNEYGYGTIYKKLAEITFAQGTPFRLTINMATGWQKDNGKSIFGDFIEVE